MASITSPVLPNKRLIVCPNPDLAARRARKREELLAATTRTSGASRADKSLKPVEGHRS
jgi:hypothetical protein